MRLPISALLMICFAGICFFLFISFSYVFNDSDSGIKNILWDSANETMSGDRLSRFNDWMPMISQGFGVAGVMLVGMAVVFFVVDALGDDNRRRLQ